MTARRRRASTCGRDRSGDQTAKGLLIVTPVPSRARPRLRLWECFRTLGQWIPLPSSISPNRRMDTARQGCWPISRAGALHIMGEGFYWETQDRARDIAAATSAWERGKELILRTPSHGALDELNIVWLYDYLDLNDVPDIPAARKSPSTSIVVITGPLPSRTDREATSSPEMTLVNHRFRAGVRARRAIGFGCRGRRLR